MFPSSSNRIARDSDVYRTCGLILYITLAFTLLKCVHPLTLRPPHLILNPGGVLVYCPHQNFTGSALFDLLCNVHHPVDLRTLCV